MTRKELRVYQLPQKEYKLVQDVRKHPALGAYPATELECILDQSSVGFSNSLAPGQVKLIRDLAAAHGVMLPR